MNFEIKSSSFAALATEKTDALIVLVPHDFKPGSTKLGAAIAQAVKDGDMGTAPAKSLTQYRSSLVVAKCMVWVGVGSGAPKEVAKAVGAAVAQLKTAAKIVISLHALARASEAQSRAAALSAASASYVFTTTKPGATARKIKSLVLATESATPGTLQQDISATIAGIEFAKEWANRPGNHATPTMLGNAAKTLAKFPKLSVTEMGPKEVAKWGMGSFMDVYQG